MTIKTLCLFSLLGMACTNQETKLSLAGDWEFTTDSTRWNQLIQLPGSMTSNGLGEEISLHTDWTGSIIDSSYFKNDSYYKYRQPGHERVPFWLQPVTYYKGVAWYKKEVVIPENWANKDLSLFLERCHWETRLWIDDVEIGMQNALGAPHRYDLTDKLTPGKHLLTLRVDNQIKQIDPGVNSHSLSDHTQGNWNGIVGAIYLEAKPLVNINHVAIYPERLTKRVAVKTTLINRKQERVKALLKLEVENEIVEKSIELQPGSNEVEAYLALNGGLKLWDEFTPNLYDLTLTLEDEVAKTKDSYQDRFGFRDFKVTEGKLTINGRPLFLRGTLDCAVFPKTGYPPTDVDSWRTIFKASLDHGLNHIRFHSWCPPKAAFVAADEMGLYLEVECSTWPNQSTTIGDGRALDGFIWEESEAIVREFGNHPSFCMMMHGNEPAGAGSHNYLTQFVSSWKERDSRRLYASSGGWPNLSVNDFLSDPTPRVQGWGEGLKSIINAQAPRSDYDWSTYINRFSQPVVSHEIGQWCAYPNFKEIEKYDGVMRAKNFEIFQESLKENGLIHLADSFLWASGKLQTLCYKADIEAALRTKDFGGFQLLGLSDFPGQGTALVGVLDAFWEEKGYVTPQAYKEFCNSTVPLLRVPKFIYTNEERLIGEVEIAHFGADTLQVESSYWRLQTNQGKEIAAGSLAHSKIGIGNCIELGSLDISLNSILTPSALTLVIQTGEFENRWNFWCYPAHPPQLNEEEKLLITDKLDAVAIQRLQQGGKVLLSLKKGSLNKTLGGEIEVGFSSIFWNTAWTLGQAPHTLGILCNPEHPALSLFPTNYHSDYQWWDAMSHSNAIELSKFSSQISPLVRVIDDWFTNRSLALVFEVKVGEGSLLVSTIDFWSDMEKRVEAKQLLYSLKSYMLSADFNPQVSLSLDEIVKMMNNTNDLP
ncbi:MAG: sugar-binding domain-containing protein [Phocaeicola sp.]